VINIADQSYNWTGRFVAGNGEKNSRFIWKASREHDADRKISKRCGCELQMSLSWSTAQGRDCLGGFFQVGFLTS
jgi:hypothetical protein